MSMINEPQREAVALKPCPFCQQPLFVWEGINPFGRCDTEGCWLNRAAISIDLDDPKTVARWNTRPDAALSAMQPSAVDEGLLAAADKAVEWALDSFGGYVCTEVDAGISYMQMRGKDRWSMQAQMDAKCFACGGTAYSAEGDPCPLCYEAPPSPAPDARVRWQPIETAPKNGTRLLAYEDGNIYAAEWVPEMPQDGFWKSYCGQYVTIPPEPTHWMPLPLPPGDPA